MYIVRRNLFIPTTLGYCLICWTIFTNLRFWQRFAVCVKEFLINYVYDNAQLSWISFITMLLIKGRETNTIDHLNAWRLAYLLDFVRRYLTLWQRFSTSIEKLCLWQLSIQLAIFITMFNSVIDRETDPNRPRDARPLAYLLDYIRRHLPTLAKAYAAA